MVGVVLLAICVSVSAVSADDGWSFNWSSSDSSNSDGGFDENKTAEILAEPAKDDNDAKFSACEFVNGDKIIVTKVFFLDDDNEFKTLNPSDDGSSIKATMAGIEGIFFADKYDDQTPTFEYLKDGKIVEVNAPDNETIEAVIK